MQVSNSSNSACLSKCKQNLYKDSDSAILLGNKIMFNVVDGHAKRKPCLFDLKTLFTLRKNVSAQGTWNPVTKKCRMLRKYL